MYVVLIIALAAVVLIAVSVAQVYRSIPLIELKRRARHGDKVSKKLYKVAAYKVSSQFVLWLIAGVASAGFFVVLSRKSPVWISLTGSAVLIWIAYAWIPRSSINIVSQFLAVSIVSPLSWLLQYINSTVLKVYNLVGKEKNYHTGLYEKADLISLLKLQNKQEDSRIDKFEIKMMERVLSFNDKKVSDIMSPKRKVVTVAGDDMLGPIVLDELHKSQQTLFPVHDKKPANIIGILDLNSAIDFKDTAKASTVMSKRIFYVHEDEKLSSLMDTITKTHQQLFLVVNSHSEYIGIVSARAVLTELVGDDLADEFDQHESLEAVANRFSEPDIIDEIPTDNDQ